MSKRARPPRFKVSVLDRELGLERVFAASMVSVDVRLDRMAMDTVPGSPPYRFTITGTDLLDVPLPKRKSKRA